MVAAKAGGSVFWGDGQLATATAEGALRKGQAAPLLGATVLAELLLHEGWKLRLAGEGMDLWERLPVPGGRQVVFGRGALVLQVHHLDVGVEAWVFSAGRAPVGNGPGFRDVEADWTALATLGYRR
jgi:hypothetical protein